MSQGDMDSSLDEALGSMLPNLPPPKSPATDINIESTESTKAAAEVGGGGGGGGSPPLSLSQLYAYTYTDANLLASNKNKVLRQILDYLDVVQYDEYKRTFLNSGLDEAKLRDLCSGGTSCLMDSFLSDVIGYTVDETTDATIHAIHRHNFEGAIWYHRTGRPFCNDLLAQSRLSEPTMSKLDQQSATIAQGT